MLSATAFFTAAAPSSLIRISIPGNTGAPCTRMPLSRTGRAETAVRFLLAEPISNHPGNTYATDIFEAGLPNSDSVRRAPAKVPFWSSDSLTAAVLSFQDPSVFLTRIVSSEV
ncbi:Uncharacterised protein [Mycobacteroides abscessus subsp. abscessus]|nr:Uncharacterised protein [Mycobacteroides abscessus subsp. abscessus]